MAFPQVITRGEIGMMFSGIPQRLRRRRVLKGIELAMSSNSFQKLDNIKDVQGVQDEILLLMLQAAKATLLLAEKDRRISQSAFNTLYTSVKSASDPERSFLKTYCLYYFAVLRGAHSDCFAHASRAHRMPGVHSLRKSLRMPRPVERNMIGSVITASR